jgi:phosphotransferase system HPr-like phosphotransfer protein
MSLGAAAGSAILVQATGDDAAVALRAAIRVLASEI